ncbi:MAG: hypothetical protein CL840_11195 [Crocinitomicaceae bacterium]|nr:hypothetical protein [Crocinitomicaceae bacterium]|tara:strand:+ start:7462 stop:8160 length:699 start_codon:yes stop_codon:yes gene_type:complete
MKKSIERKPIYLWANDDRPREKLIEKGRTALSDAELLAILIGTGSKEESAFDLCKRILGESENNLYQLGKQSIHDLMKFNGIGEAKAISIIAAMELGRRRKQNGAIKRNKISSSQAVYELFHGLLSDISYEEFWILLLNRGNKVIKLEKISTGGITGTVADTKIILKSAVDHMASSIILVHNHPSGNCQPSQSDISITKKIKEAGKLLDVSVIDHIIIAENNYYSFADERLI